MKNVNVIENTQLLIPDSCIICGSKDKDLLEPGATFTLQKKAKILIYYSVCKEKHGPIDREQFFLIDKKIYETLKELVEMRNK